MNTVWCDVYSLDTNIIIEDTNNFCGKVICEKCSQNSAINDQCPQCRMRNCPRRLISNQLNSNVMMFFQSTKDSFMNFDKINHFQQSRLQNYVKFLSKKSIYLDEQMKTIDLRLEELERIRNEKLRNVEQLQNLKQQDEIKRMELDRNQNQLADPFDEGDISFAKLFKSGFADASFEERNAQKSLLQSRETNNFYRSRHIDLLSKTQFNPNRFDYKTPKNELRKTFSTKSKSLVTKQPFTLSLSSASKSSDSNRYKYNKLNDKKTFQLPSSINNQRKLYNSTPKIGHEKQTTDFGISTRPPSSIISASSIYFRQKREFFKKNISNHSKE
ncbi:hypothetical protein SSS_04128 [Sarcoptes scabiei]|uniref:Uncharacterized protein n=1 Tax=Sarcoptes scabiei TaxID=52283 RepID=A0A834VCS9_SARSC|nr:hypothetical protein SSS_04128 [Sarcoptes scabiei]